MILKKIEVVTVYPNGLPIARVDVKAVANNSRLANYYIHMMEHGPDSVLSYNLGQTGEGIGRLLEYGITVHRKVTRTDRRGNEVVYAEELPSYAGDTSGIMGLIKKYHIDMEPTYAPNDHWTASVHVQDAEGNISLVSYTGPYYEAPVAVILKAAIGDSIPLL